MGAGERCLDRGRFLRAGGSPPHRPGLDWTGLDDDGNLGTDRQPFVTLAVIEALDEIGYMGNLPDRTLAEVPWAANTTELLLNRGVTEEMLTAAAIDLHHELSPELPDGPIAVPALLYMCLPFVDRGNPGDVMDPPAGLVNPDDLRGRVLDALRSRQRLIARPDRLDPETASQTASAFEPAIASLSRAGQDGVLDPDHDEYLRSTIESIELRRQRPDANPRIFELLLADLVKFLLPQLADPSELAERFEALGADVSVARELADDVAESIASMSELGGDDAVRDAEVLGRIAEAADRTAAGVELLAAGDEPKAEKLRTALAKGAASQVGKRSTDLVLGGLGTLVVTHWAQIQLALLSGWRSIIDLRR